MKIFRKKVRLLARESGVAAPALPPQSKKTPAGESLRARQLAAKN
jgi:hypothetical protein